MACKKVGGDHLTLWCARGDLAATRNGGSCGQGCSHKGGAGGGGPKRERTASMNSGGSAEAPPAKANKSTKRCSWCGHRFRLLLWQPFHKHGHCTVPDTAPDDQPWLYNPLPTGFDDRKKPQPYRFRQGEQPGNSVHQRLRRERNWGQGCKCTVCVLDTP